MQNPTYNPLEAFSYCVCGGSNGNTFTVAIQHNKMPVFPAKAIIPVWQAHFFYGIRQSKQFVGVGRCSPPRIVIAGGVVHFATLQQFHVSYKNIHIKNCSTLMKIPRLLAFLYNTCSRYTANSQTMYYHTFLGHISPHLLPSIKPITISCVPFE